MTKYIVNYDSERIGVFAAIRQEFIKYSGFNKYGVKKICIPKLFNGIKESADEETSIDGVPIEIDNQLHLGQFSIIMETFPKKETEQPQNNTDVVYIVRVKPEFQINFKDTTINHKFAGKILAQIRDAYVFELNGAYDALVIIPFDWIECMAPSKAHFELMQKSTPLYCCGRPLQAINKKIGKCGKCGSEYWIED